MGYTVQMRFFQTLHVWLENLLGERLFHLLRYLISGGTAATTHVSALFVLVQFAGFHYLMASVFAYILAIGVSFTLQKFWTFQDKLVHDVHMQFGRYITVVLANLILNTFLMYILVSHAGLWYVLAQILTTAVVAVTGYFGYKHFVFVKRTVE